MDQSQYKCVRLIFILEKFLTNKTKNQKQKHFILK